MSRLKFAGRLLLVTIGITFFQLCAAELLAYQVIHPTAGDTIAMLTMPAPVLIGFLALFLVCVYLYIRPVLSFLTGLLAGEKFDAARIERIQDKVMTFPYFMVVLNYPFWMAGGAISVWIICARLGWPHEPIIYGFFGGLISSLAASPMAVYGYTWVMKPIVDLSAQSAPGLEPARRAGIKISLMMKLIITVITLVLASSAYTVVVVEKQDTDMLENMKKMELLLPGQVRESLVDRVEKTIDLRVKSSEYFDNQVGNMLIFYITIMAAAGLISLILAVAAALDITRPLRVLKRAAMQVQEGKYSEPVQLISNDEISELASVFNQMTLTIVGHIKAMEEVVAHLEQGIHEIDETVTTVVLVSQNQSKGATSQASSLHQTSDIAKQIAYTAKSIEDRSKTMDRVAESTLSSSQEGKQKLERSREEFFSITDQMEELHKAMAQLEVRFRETNRIVAIIQDMAEKTEVLSLNASIEAAGFGLENGRFNMVADETRNLSLKSTEAVKKIKNLVDAIQKATLESISVTEQGKSKVLESGKTIESALETLTEIAATAESTFAAVKEIKNSTGMQTRASEELAESVSEIYKVSKEVEKGANQINSTITSLQRVAESMRRTVRERSA
jgi:methyl-accepting chemotaxis protein